ncbi:MAG: hypothetical protein U0T69_01210 [Chitinophagales bacterium]
MFRRWLYSVWSDVAYAQPSLWNEFFPFVPYNDMLNKWYPKVKNILNFSQIPDDLLNTNVFQFARVGLKQCEKAGMEKVMLNAGVDFNIIKENLTALLKNHLQVASYYMVLITVIRTA